MTTLTGGPRSCGQAAPAWTSTASTLSVYIHHKGLSPLLLIFAGIDIPSNILLSSAYWDMPANDANGWATALSQPRQYYSTVYATLKQTMVRITVCESFDVW